MHTELINRIEALQRSAKIGHTSMWTFTHGRPRAVESCEYTTADKDPLQAVAKLVTSDVLKHWTPDWVDIEGYLQGPVEVTGADLLDSLYECPAFPTGPQLAHAYSRGYTLSGFVANELYHDDRACFYMGTSGQLVSYPPHEPDRDVSDGARWMFRFEERLRIPLYTGVLPVSGKSIAMLESRYTIPLADDHELAAKIADKMAEFQEGAPGRTWVDEKGNVYSPEFVVHPTAIGSTGIRPSLFCESAPRVGLKFPKRLADLCPDIFECVTVVYGDDMLRLRRTPPIPTAQQLEELGDNRYKLTGKAVDCSDKVGRKGNKHVFYVGSNGEPKNTCNGYESSDLFDGVRWELTREYPDLKLAHKGDQSIPLYTLSDIERNLVVDSVLREEEGRMDVYRWKVCQCAADGTVGDTALRHVVAACNPLHAVQVQIGRTDKLDGRLHYYRHEDSDGVTLVAIGSKPGKPKGPRIDYGVIHATYRVVKEHSRPMGWVFNESFASLRRRKWDK
jgi:hypothetical protein